VRVRRRARPFFLRWRFVLTFLPSVMAALVAWGCRCRLAIWGELADSGGVPPRLRLAVDRPVLPAQAEISPVPGTGDPHHQHHGVAGQVEAWVGGRSQVHVGTGLLAVKFGDSMERLSVVPSRDLGTIRRSTVRLSELGGQFRTYWPEVSSRCSPIPSRPGGARRSSPRTGSRTSWTAADGPATLCQHRPA
jgi:hypothetical protein